MDEREYQDGAYLLRRIKKIEASGRLCQGRVEPAWWNDDGKCSSQGVERTSQDGVILGQYCIRHYRMAFPEIASAKVPPKILVPSRVPDNPLDALSPRTHNCLKRAQIRTKDAVLFMTDNELLGLRNFGAQSLAEVRAILGEQITKSALLVHFDRMSVARLGG